MELRLLPFVRREEREDYGKKNRRKTY